MVDVATPLWGRMSADRQLSLVPAEEARDEAIAQVQQPGDSELWIRAAVDAVKVVRQRRGAGAHFTTDAVWAILEAWKVEAPREPRALGAAMMRAKQLGLCVPTAMTQKSVRVDCHARPVRVWKLT